MKLSSIMLSAFWSMYLHMLLLFTYNSPWFHSITIALDLGNETDYVALLKFKESISNDPYGILDSWNSSAHFCDWHGITCNLMHQRVTELNLTGHHLNGFMSPHIANLTFLRNLILADNNFYSKIPQELCRLLHLQVLDLNKNSLVGEIPKNLINCSQLTTFDLSRNNLIGKIPFEIGSLRKLQLLYLFKNNLNERIPPSVGNLSSLIILSVGSNNLEGNIPQEFCHMKNLSQMSLHVNNLSGTLPSCLYNMSSLTIISTSANKFNGSLSPHMFNTLPNLQLFEIGDNQFSGPIPTSITNATDLQVLDISRNHFTGQFPNLGKLQDFSVLSTSFNHLGGNSTKDLEFLKPLTNTSSMLRVLSISSNNFGGCLPNFLGNLSTQLSQLYLGDNHISGKLPTELANLNNLTLLGMENNHFEGIIPATFGKFQMMQRLKLNGNKLSGDITFIGNLSNLYFLDLSHNKLEGNIPPSIGNCQKLQSLDLSHNNLRGPITSEVFTILSLTNLLNLSQNLLSGSLPVEVGRLKNIEWLDVSDNHLSGDIPTTIRECISLEYLYLQGNTFHGIIPSSLTSLRGLRKLDLSRNYLAGTIPKGLQNISVLEYLNVSFNMLDGEVPTEGVFKNTSTFTMFGNGKLCGGILELHLPPCHDKGSKISKGLIAMIACVISFTLVLSLTLTIYLIRKINKKPSSASTTIEHLPKVSYQSLHNGTDGFSTRNIIGYGGFGSVYKGTIESQDKVVAIKVLNLQVKGAHNSFIAECNALGNIRHRNLVKILTCCSGTDYKSQEFKAIVYEFMTNGSLESWLHPTMEVADLPKSLSFVQRLNIISDVAFALHYLHYECEQVIIHCDLKPSNILLDDCFVARVSDFGLAKLLSSVGQFPKHTSTTGLKGTIGYAPPEYGMGSEVSIEGDMYSFGILVLEILTGRRPTNEMFEDDQNLHNYVKTSIPSHLLHIVDPTILWEELERANDKENLTALHPNVKECLLSLFRIALACSTESPKERMSMVDVIKELDMMKKSFPSNRTNRG